MFHVCLVYKLEEEDGYTSTTKASEQYAKGETCHKKPSLGPRLLRRQRELGVFCFSRRCLIKRSRLSRQFAWVVLPKIGNPLCGVVSFWFHPKRVFTISPTSLLIGDGRRQRSIRFILINRPIRGKGWPRFWVAEAMTITQGHVPKHLTWASGNGPLRNDHDPEREHGTFGPFPRFNHGIRIFPPRTSPSCFHKARPGLLVCKRPNGFLSLEEPGEGGFQRLQPTVAMTGNGELGFDSGEGARETATTSKEGSRRANYPILTQGGSDKR